MELKREGDEIQITMTARELASVIQDMWGHSWGLSAAGQTLNDASKDVGIRADVVNPDPNLKLI